MHIAERHLIPKLLKEHGLPTAQVQLPHDVLRHVVQNYTREVCLMEVDIRGYVCTSVHAKCMLCSCYILQSVQPWMVLLYEHF